MKPEEARAWVTLAVAGLVGFLAWRAYRGAADTAAGVGEAIGRGWDAVKDAAGEAVEWVAELPERATEGFIKEASPYAGELPHWTANRDTLPLIDYFRRWGNTEPARNEALRAGWTWNEISQAVGVLAAEQMGWQ